MITKLPNPDAPPTSYLFPPQFVNTALLFLLVYGKAPEGYTTPEILQQFKILSGPYSDFSRDWQVRENVAWTTTSLSDGSGGGGMISQLCVDVNMLDMPRCSVRDRRMVNGGCGCDNDVERYCYGITVQGRKMLFLRILGISWWMFRLPS